MCDCRRRGVCGVSHGCRVEPKKGVASCELSLLQFAIWSAVRIPVVVRQSNYCSKIDGNCVSYPSHRWILTYRRIHHHLLIITIIIITGGFVHRLVNETSFDISSSSSPSLLLYDSGAVVGCSMDMWCPYGIGREIWDREVPRIVC